MGKIIHFAKCLEFAAMGGSVKTVALKLNGFNGFRNNIPIYHRYIKREKIVFHYCFYTKVLERIYVNT